MWLTHRSGIVVILLAFIGALAACGVTTPEPQPAPTPEPQSTPAPTAAATSSPLLATPQVASAEEPLQGKIPDIPNVFVVGARQSKAALAAFLKTTPDQLDWVNPGLPDPVAPGTLVVIPPIYRASGETLSDVSQKTGLPEDLLRAANPQLGGETVLPEGTMLAVPALYIVPEDTLLSSTAQTLATSDEALLSANPQLAGQEEHHGRNAARGAPGKGESLMQPETVDTLWRPARCCCWFWLRSRPAMSWLSSRFWIRPLPRRCGCWAAT